MKRANVDWAFGLALESMKGTNSHLPIGIQHFFAGLNCEEFLLTLFLYTQKKF